MDVHRAPTRKLAKRRPVRTARGAFAGGIGRIAAAAAIVAALGCLTGARAGPPFLTDDPDPVDLHHWEFYVFELGYKSAGSDLIEAPAIELNYGVAPDTQLHLIAPIANFSSPGAEWASGYGDTEVGIKYRLARETDSQPEVGIFPMAEVATGDGSRGLGNGRTWYRLPLWIQKSWGPWTTYGGGGAALNSAPGQRNYGFAGWLVQRDIGKYLTLGSELYWQGADTAADRGFLALNAGGYIKFSDSFNLLFSVGRSLSGDVHTFTYLGLYWTWGPVQPEKK
jgi:hypothetical protein